MDTSKLERFAKYARRYLLEQVRIKLDKVLADGSDERRRNSKQVLALEEELKRLKSKDLLIDKVAYTWFNRFCALRFMDVNRYTRIGILSPLPGQSQPEILAEAKMGHIDEDMVTKDNQQKVYDLLSGTAKHEDPQSEAYRILIMASCNYYALIMPFLFERIADWTELLMPDDLLSSNSILTIICEAMTQDNCKDVEVIGWLYQYYISEKKDEVFKDLSKNIKIKSEDIPSATQIFTPHWIVRFMVENSLGRLWILNHANSSLSENMRYYIKAEQSETAYHKINTPQEIRFCDPCSGSGHVLTYAFDLLYAMYEEDGFNLVEIPQLIIKNNLFGIEIDERAGELAAFALTMKARAKDKLWFNRKIEPNICVLASVSIAEDELDKYMRKIGYDVFSAKLETTLKQFTETNTYGSLIVPADTNVVETYNMLIDNNEIVNDTEYYGTHKAVVKILRQADYLNSKYHIVVTNPPYMGSKGMNNTLSDFAKTNYPLAKSDLFAMFIQRCLELVLDRGFCALVTMQSWMFLSSYEKLRSHLLDNYTIECMVHMDNMVMGIAFGTSATVWQKFLNPNFKGSYSYLSCQDLDENNTPKEFPVKNSRLAVASSSDFINIPGTPIAYWVSERVRSIYANSDKVSDIANVVCGMTTGDNDQFLRLWFEVSHAKTGFGYTCKNDAILSKNKWFPYNKGGSFRKWFGNNEYVINWGNDGYDVITNGRAFARSQNFYYKESITWSFVSSSYFGVRVSDPGFLFDMGGCSAFLKKADYQLVLSAYLCSKLVFNFLKILNPTLNFQVGNVGSLPWLESKIIVNKRNIDHLSNLLLNVSKQDWDSFETSWNFTRSPLLMMLNLDQMSVKEVYFDLRKQWIDNTIEMHCLEEENNGIFIEAYGLQNEFSPDVPLKEITLTCNPYYRYSKEANQEFKEEFPLNEKLEADLLSDTMKEYISYALGCMLGRYSIDKPGLILANQGETIDDYLKQVPNPSFIPDKDNVIPILDGEWFTDDIVERFKEFLKVTFGYSNFSQNLQFIEEAIGKDLRSYFLKDFYNDHIKRYKKRPIYWLFSSPKDSFNALIYMHRYTPDTASIILNDYLREFVVKLNAKKADLEHQIISSSTCQRDKIIAGKELEKITATILELENWERNVIFNLAAAKIEIDLDDGVKVNYAKFGTALKKIPGLDKSEE